MAGEFKSSPYSVLFADKGIFALYHTINKELAYLDQTSYDLVRGYLCDDTTVPQDHDLISFLVDKGFLVEHPDQERERIVSLVATDHCNSKISTLYIILTTNCNLRCSYCFVENNLHNQTHSVITKETIREGIDYYLRQDLDYDQAKVVLYGGEPFLEQDLLKYAVSYIRQKINDKNARKIIDIIINTNGTNFSEDMIYFLKKNHCSVCVSVDGNKETHDRIRHDASGGGSFDKALATIKDIAKAGIKFSISFTIGRHNIYDLTENVVYLTNLLNPSFISFNFVLDFKDRVNDLSVPAEDLITKLKDTYSEILRAGIEEGKFYQRLDAFWEPYSFFNYCCAYGKQMVLLPNGDIGPCHAFAGAEDFLAKRPFPEDIRKDGVFAEWAQRTMAGNVECQECKYLFLCGGGCAYNSYIHHGNINGIDKRNCEITRMMVEQYVAFCAHRTISHGHETQNNHEE